ncbi:MAG: phospholipase D family protein [Clostridiales bacterium]|nr:phospholipase D family protein [Clostridiales bacterium]
MFNPKSSKDRLNYGEVLMPPVGYWVERAVGTTYSLDIETLTAISLSLGLIEDTDSELINNSISMLNALQKISSRITVFCEAGQIKLPRKNNTLSLLLERMVVPVKLPYDNRIGRYPSFHPKTWLLEYENSEGNKLYRFVVMSRNMTFDHSWDIACALDGELMKGEQRTSSPLRNFFRYLKTQLDGGLSDYDRQNKDLTYFVDIIPRIRFSADEKFSSFKIMPLGIGRSGYDMSSDPLFNENFHELVVMTPFLSGSVIQNLNSDWKSLTGTERTLITRKTELSKLSRNKASNFDVYVMKDDVVDGESAISESDTESEMGLASKQDIHAKLYIRRKSSNVDLYIGSMNASAAAINSNVEMVLYLQTRKGILNGRSFLDDVMGVNRDDKSNPFELVEISDTTNDTEPSSQDIAEQLIKDVSRLEMKAKVSLQTNDKYNLQITTEYSAQINGVSIRPLRLTEGYELNRLIEFVDLELLQLSEFYVVSATVDDFTLERVIMIPTEGIPEERDSSIIRSVINNRRAFIEYVAFVLGDDYVQTFLENSRADGSFAEWKKAELMPAVYEKMLKASVSNPERIKEIQLITKVIDDDAIIPPEFTEMYNEFCEALGIR